MKTRDEKIDEAANKYGNPCGLTDLRLPVKNNMKRISEAFLDGARFGVTMGREEMLKEVLEMLRGVRASKYGISREKMGYIIAPSAWADWLENEFKAEPQESKEKK